MKGRHAIITWAALSLILAACAAAAEMEVEVVQSATTTTTIEHSLLDDTPPSSAMEPGPEEPLVTQPMTAPSTSEDPAPPAPAGGSAVIPDQQLGGLQSFIEAARLDLARRLDIGTDVVVLLGAEKVTWSDSSLGCPEPGKVYLQVLIEGALIRLRFDDSDYSYHAGEGLEPFLCEDRSRYLTSPTAHDALIDQARNDLAQRAAVEPQEILLISVQTTGALATSPCTSAVLDIVDPQEGMVPAVEVVLRTGAEAHRYVSVADVLHYCGVAVASGK